MRDYHTTGKYGRSSQGHPVRARRRGHCHLCGKPYPAGEPMIHLPGTTSPAHPTCVYGETVTTASRVDS